MTDDELKSELEVFRLEGQILDRLFYEQAASIKRRLMHQRMDLTVAVCTAWLKREGPHNKHAEGERDIHNQQERTMGQVPVYLSRHGDLPDKYGALVEWEVGDPVSVTYCNGKRVDGVIQSGTMTHEQAPEIKGARGFGRWVREVLCADDGQVHAISEERLRDVSHSA